MIHVTYDKSSVIKLHLTHISVFVFCFCHMYLLSVKAVDPWETIISLKLVRTRRNQTQMRALAHLSRWEPLQEKSWLAN